ncbi:UbiA family prenyltransferase [Bradyrhizobium septentrionale]|uniref:UbiA family prenyltransferase n=1 Tax=Bradyrhizobium septentrionale TaxID=1404411 RepID=A0A974A381_9BRAD|nr:UbiA family prenyltransferase [Bradyrhizobium septentrionale]UGY14806.1 UbiA family prenyltransferase [Bradyrhizobium septentrionale]UGY23377.1 UbiA family prenyltransferase [Bradyrhizobium septentrionale]
MSVTNHAQPAAGITDYIAIARPDHWIKHVLIIPGVAFALIMSQTGPIELATLAERLVICLFVAMALSSANYTINEWLDAPFDAMHPTKRARPAVQTAMSPTIVLAQYALLTAVGIFAANRLGYAFAATATVFAVFGVIYNVRPIRAKDRAFVDVIVESLNNPLRFLFGWFAVVPSIAPPVSILLAYWFGGAFLMAAKRVSEHRAIVEAGGTANLAAYRPSFAVYTHSSLVTSCLVYAQGFAFMMAIFLLKYRIEYLVVVPMLIALFAAYMRLALTPDSAAARPEELMRQPAMLIAAAVTMALFGVLTFVDLPWLNSLTSSDLIRLGGIR